MLDNNLRQPNIQIAALENKKITKVKPMGVQVVCPGCLYLKNGWAHEDMNGTNQLIIKSCCV